MLCSDKSAAVTTTSGLNSESVVVDYVASRRDAAMKMSFEDSLSFFAGSEFVVANGAMKKEQFENFKKSVVEEMLDNPRKVKKVMIDLGKVAGFICFYKFEEQSLESMGEKTQAAGIQLTPEVLATVKAMHPHIKETAAECKTLALIKAIAFSSEFRRRGYTRALINNAIEHVKTYWLRIESIMVDLNVNDNIARRLYETEGFKVSANQPAHLEMMKVVQYEKNIKKIIY